MVSKDVLHSGFSNLIVKCSNNLVKPDVTPHFILIHHTTAFNTKQDTDTWPSLVEMFYALAFRNLQPRA